MESLSPQIEPLIKVHPITKKAGVLYEKIRYLVDYQEEHQIRRNAIERILTRKQTFESGPAFSLELLRELVTGGYLAEGRVSEELVKDVQAILDHYRSSDKHQISFAATEINFFLFPLVEDEAVVDSMYSTVRPAITFAPALDSHEADLQVYLACRRTLLKEDQATLRYVLFKRFGNTDAGVLNHAVTWQLLAKLKNQGIYFAIIREIVSQYGVQSEQLFTDHARLDQFVLPFLERQYQLIRNRVRTGSIRAVTYLFCTKIVLAFLLEVPYDLLIVGALDYLALGINVVFHPLLLFVMTRFISLPDAKNTKNILAGLHDVLGGGRTAGMTVRTKSSHPAMDTIFTVLYAILSIGVFYALYTGLRYLHFNIVSMLLFLLFLTLVSYFGIRIRRSAQAWKLTAPSQSFGSLLWDLFTLPIIRAGRWLSARFSSVNVFVFFLDFIIETPFKMLLNVSDSFLSFLREKKDEISI